MNQQSANPEDPQNYFALFSLPRHLRIDTAALEKAFTGAQAVYALIPPNVAAADTFSMTNDATAGFAYRFYRVVEQADQ